jgi:hypothetical protein
MDKSESVSKDKQTLMRGNSVLKEKEVNLRIIINKIKEWVDKNMTKTENNTSANHHKIKEPACRLIYIQREESLSAPLSKRELLAKFEQKL